MKIFKSLLVLGTALAGPSLLAQQPPGPPEIPAADSAPVEVSKSQKAPGAGYLAKRFGLSELEARQRLALDEKITESTASFVEAFGDDFVGVFIDHEPNYRVTYVIARDVPVGDAQKMVAQELRRYVAVKRSKYTVSELDVLNRRIADTLANMKLPGTVGYDFRTDKFEISATETAGQKLMPALPTDLRSVVRFVPGGKPQTVQTGARSGDVFYGGWQFFPAPGTGTPTCTYAFSIRTGSGQDGMLTASSGHCQGNAAYKYPDGHTVTLVTPAEVDRFVFNNSGRSYDYRQVRTGTIKPGPYVWFWNNRGGNYYQKTLSGWEYKSWANVNPNYPIEGGYSQVTGAVLGSSANTQNYNHAAGQTRCLGGQTTGITCGLITASSTTAVEVLDDGSTRQYYGYVKVEGQDYMVLANGGDSGGPAVTEPVWNSTAGYYQVKAAGIVLIGSVRDRGDGYDRPCVMPGDQSCPAYYMPIDRINDHAAGTILTTTGAVAVN
ncbi:hypothetical protein [Altererythrobacter aquiaggeris]|uniref:hypothetical protein n=1 Tax=Aestuarierythrobacter aquiaggeris TaxID=1898396 RepID=UPI0030178161